MAFRYSPKIITNGLVLALDAANPKSYPGTGTVITDLVNKTTGTFNTGPTFSSNNSGYLSFDGTDDWITLATATPSSAIKTISFWYKQAYLPGTATLGYFFSNQGTGEAQKGLARNEDSNGRLYYYNGTTVTYITSTTTGDPTIPINTYANWQNITLIENSTTNTLSLYWQGNFMKNVTITNMGINIKTIGKGFTGGGVHPLMGNISQFLVYNRALSSQEILQNYNAIKHRFGI